MAFFIFIICMFCGILSGTVYDVFYVARAVCCGIDKQRYTVKDKIFIIISDLLYCITFAVGFIFTAVMFDFENLRFYMLLGCVLGAIVYLKSIHLIVAFFVKKVYNAYSIHKEKKVGRTKEKPSGGSRHGKRYHINGNSRRGNNLSAG